MKQLKFLTNISLEGKSIWFKDCIYQVMGETDDMYKLICEDLVPRGIGKNSLGRLYTLIEIEDKKPIPKKEIKAKTEEKPKTVRKTKKSDKNIEA